MIDTEIELELELFTKLLMSNIEANRLYIHLLLPFIPKTSELYQQLITVMALSKDLVENLQEFKIAITEKDDENYLFAKEKNDASQKQ
jgi:hypothetical protein